jgi:hypothetical protein
MDQQNQGGEQVDLTAEAILGQEDLPKQRVIVPEWKGCVWVRSITGEERDAFEVGMVEQRGPDRVTNMRNVRARLVALCACDAEGKRIFTDQQAEALGRKNARALERLFVVARRLNGILTADVAELVGN